MSNDTNISLGISGHVHIKLYNKYGEIIEERYNKNLIVNKGRTAIVNRILGTGGIAAPSYIGIGNGGATAPASNQTALLGSVLSSRIAVTPVTALQGVVVAAAGDPANQIQWSGTFPINNPSSNAVINEAGIFTSSTGGNLFARTTFSDITKNTTDTLSITWVLTVTAT